jgi:hypothetical protein
VKRIPAPPGKKPKNAKEKQKIYTAIWYCSLYMVEDGNVSLVASIFPHKPAQEPKFRATFQYTTHAFISGWGASFIPCELDSRSETKIQKPAKLLESSSFGAFLTTANQNPGTSETSQ